MSKEFLHMTEEGRQMKLCEMHDAHLVNTINLIKRKAKEGLRIPLYPIAVNDVGIDYITIKGTDAETYCELEQYINEAIRRGFHLRKLYKDITKLTEEKK